MDARQWLRRRRSGNEAWGAAFPGRWRPFAPGRRTAVRTIRKSPRQTGQPRGREKGVGLGWQELHRRRAMPVGASENRVRSAREIEAGRAVDASVARSGHLLQAAASRHGGGIGDSSASQAATRESARRRAVPSARPRESRGDGDRVVQSITPASPCSNRGCAQPHRRSATRKAHITVARDCTTGGARVASRQGPRIELRESRSVGKGGTMKSAVEFRSGSVPSDGGIPIGSERRVPRSLSRARIRCSESTARDRL